MDTATASIPARPDFELRFHPLFGAGRGYSFPCDRFGHVDIDALSPGARENYLFARAVIGFEVAFPAVLASDLH